MRVLPILLLALTTCQAQSDQSKVDAVLKQMEHALQTGDFSEFSSVWTPAKSAELEKLRPYVRPRPDTHYRALKTYVRGDEAVLQVQAAADNFFNMTLRKEGGQWKVQEQFFRNTAPDPNSVYALVLPDPGAFSRAGSPWNQVAPGMPPGQAARAGWQIKAVFDESYLYIRIESGAVLPAPGSTIEKPSGGWPVLKIVTSGAGEFVLFDQAQIGDQATFDEHGKANSHRAYAAYAIRLEHTDREVFSASAGLDPNPLIEVSGRDYDVRIPLATMSIMDSRTTKMTLGDAQWPKSAVLSFAVQRYPL